MRKIIPITSNCYLLLFPQVEGDHGPVAGAAVDPGPVAGPRAATPTIVVTAGAGRARAAVAAAGAGTEKGDPGN